MAAKTPISLIDLLLKRRNAADHLVMLALLLLISLCAVSDHACFADNNFTGASDHPEYRELCKHTPYPDIRLTILTTYPIESENPAELTDVVISASGHEAMETVKFIKGLLSREKDRTQLENLHLCSDQYLTHVIEGISDGLVFFGEGKDEQAAASIRRSFPAIHACNQTFEREPVRENVLKETNDANTKNCAVALALVVNFIDG